MELSHHTAGAVTDGQHRNVSHQASKAHLRLSTPAQGRDPVK